GSNRNDEGGLPSAALTADRHAGRSAATAVALLVAHERAARRRRARRGRGRLLLRLEVVHPIATRRRGRVATLLGRRAGTPGLARAEDQAHGNLNLRRLRLVERVGPAGLAALHLHQVGLQEHRRDRRGRALPLEAVAADGGPPGPGGEENGRLVGCRVERVVHDDRGTVLGRV